MPFRRTIIVSCIRVSPGHCELRVNDGAKLALSPGDSIEVNVEVGEMHRVAPKPPLFRRLISLFAKSD